MIETYKIIKGVYDNQSTSILILWSNVAQRNRGRGYNMRLYLQRSLMCLRQNVFSIRIVKILNSLTEQVINSPNVNTFKSRLEKHWKNQEILYNYRADIKITAKLGIMQMKITRIRARRLQITAKLGIMQMKITRIRARRLQI